MSGTTEDYLDLITSEYRQQPDFTALISVGIDVQTHIQSLLLSMIPLFDVDTAVGDQLDAIGAWVGFSRNVSVPIPGVYFSWEGTDPYLGWEYGVWQPEDAPTDVTVLPDDVYRTFIKAKIAANRWDGTTDGAYAIWDSVFTDITILIQDNLDMSYNLAFVGGIVDSLTLALITGGYLPLKPEGVRVNEYLFPVDDNQLFSWDIETDFLGGWEVASWAREVVPS